MFSFVNYFLTFFVKKFIFLFWSGLERNSSEGDMDSRKGYSEGGQSSSFRSKRILRYREAAIRALPVAEEAR